MEEARSLAVRRVEVQFSPQRTSSEILALAFQMLTCPAEVRLSNRSSVQTPPNQGCTETGQKQEVMR